MNKILEKNIISWVIVFQAIIREKIMYALSIKIFYLVNVYLLNVFLCDIY